VDVLPDGVVVVVQTVVDVTGTVTGGVYAVVTGAAVVGVVAGTVVAGVPPVGAPPVVVFAGAVVGVAPPEVDPPVEVLVGTVVAGVPPVGAPPVMVFPGVVVLAWLAEVVFEPGVVVAVPGRVVVGLVDEAVGAVVVILAALAT
jgi:hypothetical protein